MSLSPQDVIDIRQLIDLYGHIVDEHQYSRTNDLFTAETVYDVSDFGSGIHVGAEAITDLWSAPDAKHPLAHHATNIVITVDPDATVRVLSKGMGVRRNGTVGSVVYRDIVKKTAAGWRIVERVASLRRVP